MADVGDKVLILNLNGKLVAVKPTAPETGKKSMIYNIYGKQVAVGIAPPESGKNAMMEQVYGRNCAFSFGQVTGEAWFRKGGNNLSSYYVSGKEPSLTTDWEIPMTGHGIGNLNSSNFDSLVTDTAGNIYFTSSKGVHSFDKKGVFRWTTAFSFEYESENPETGETYTFWDIVFLAIAGDLVIVADNSETGTIYGLKQSDGSISWSLTIGNLSEYSVFRHCPLVVGTGIIVLPLYHRTPVLKETPAGGSYWANQDDVEVVKIDKTGTITAQYDLKTYINAHKTEMWTYRPIEDEPPEGWPYDVEWIGFTPYLTAEPVAYRPTQNEVMFRVEYGIDYSEYEDKTTSVVTVSLSTGEMYCVAFYLMGNPD